jgi:hypothetical protein
MVAVGMPAFSSPKFPVRGIPVVSEVAVDEVVTGGVVVVEWLLVVSLLL